MSIPPTATVCARATAIGLYGTYMWATVQDDLGAALLVFAGTLICAGGGLWLAVNESATGSSDDPSDESRPAHTGADQPTDD